MVLCDRCIRAIKSRGEKIFIGDITHFDSINTCNWCEEIDEELYAVEFAFSRYTNSYMEEEYVR